MSLVSYPCILITFADTYLIVSWFESFFIKTEVFYNEMKLMSVPTIIHASCRHAAWFLMTCYYTRFSPRWRVVRHHWLGTRSCNWSRSDLLSVRLMSYIAATSTGMYVSVLQMKQCFCIFNSCFVKVNILKLSLFKKRTVY